MCVKRVCDLIYQGCGGRTKNLRAHQCDQPFEKKKVSATLKVSMVVQQQTHIRLISWSKPIRDSKDPDIPGRVCTFEDACAAAVRQTEVSGRDAHSVASLATFQTPLATFFSKKATNDKL